MKVFDAIKRGVSLVFRDRKAIGVIYLFNIALSAVVAIPLFLLFHSKVGLQMARDELAVSMPTSWWHSFQFSAEGLERTIRPVLSGGFGTMFDNLELLLTGSFSTFGWAVFFLGLGYVFIAAFFNGGAIALFADERKSFTTSRFFSNAGLFFHHMAALATTALILFFLFYKFLNPAIFSLVDSIVGDTLSQPKAWVINLLGYLVILVVVFMLTLILDYAKVIVIAEKKESSWLCIWLAIKFIFRNFLKAVGMNLLLLFFGGVILLFGGLLLAVINPANALLLVVAFAVQQFIMVANIALRLAFYASETVLYQQQSALLAPVKKRKR